MFRKSSSLESKLPKPPTRAEILEDMETFNFEEFSENSLATVTSTNTESPKGEREQQSSLDAQNGRNLDEWWQQFETYLDCIKVLENKQVQFDAKKINLARLDTTVSNMSTDITNQLQDAFDRAKTEIDEDFINLK